MLIKTISPNEYCIELATEFRSEKIPQNTRLGMASDIPRKKVLIPRHSEFTEEPIPRLLLQLQQTE
jgi:hypothetical protein